MLKPRAHQVDADERRLVDEAQQLATAALRSSRDALERPAAALMERETLSSVEIERLVSAPAPA